MSLQLGERYLAFFSVVASSSNLSTVIIESKLALFRTITKHFYLEYHIIFKHKKAPFGCNTKWGFK